MRAWIHLHDWTQILLDKLYDACYNAVAMKNNFLLETLERVIYIGKDEYSERKTSFYQSTWSQELIYVLSGETTVYFEDEILHERPDTIRYFFIDAGCQLLIALRQILALCFDP